MRVCMTPPLPAGPGSQPTGVAGRLPDRAGLPSCPGGGVDQRGPLTGYAAAALGGVLGALARWAVARALPSPAGGWPWATLLVNVTGCR